MHKGWDFWIDRGGTFTDVVARDPGGQLHVHKLLSDNPRHYPDAPMQAVRALLGLQPEDPIPPEQVAAVTMGTTLATNALLERKGADVGLLVTRGFRDLLGIGYQDRPAIFALHIVKPSVLYAAVEEVDERVLADGTIRAPLDERGFRAALTRMKDAGIDALAILFLHSYAFPGHELRAGELAREMGFGHISLSHDVVDEIKIVGRGDTTTADAYLTPLLRDYVDHVRRELGDRPRLRFMQSHGGLTDAESFRGKNAVLSGPAGGVVAYAQLFERAGFPRVIGFDMGGTSTDVSRYDGAYDRVFETRIAGVRLKAPMMAIETVAAGGGSILRYELGRFVVGPDSAGAQPGPACYGAGGPATVTDANLVLGRIQPAYFPKCFGPDSDQPLDPSAARERLAKIADQIERDTGNRMRIEAVAEGFVRIADEAMAKPIKEISTGKGYDVQDYALACFGGAGPQHACAIAEALGMRTVLLHPKAGVLSAYGMGLADAIHANVSSVLCDLDAWTPDFEPLENAGSASLRAEGFNDIEIHHVRSVDARYRGVDAYLNVTYTDAETFVAEFEAQHQALYGFTKPGHPIEIVNARTESIGTTTKPSEEPAVSLEERTVPDSLIADNVPIHFTSADSTLAPLDTPVYRRDDLQPGMKAEGPALIVEAVSTIVVDPGWRASVNAYSHLVLERKSDARTRAASLERDPILLEVFNNLFMSIAERMGKTLERVSHSANIKERLDFSCAVFTAEGDLVANAPHIPVHLGAMGESVKAVIEARSGNVKPGDVYATNDPYHGGSHLPDVTVVSPVFDGNTLRFFVANRGHHADIGGIAPGSMPPFSTSIEEEGITLHDFLLVSEGRLREDAIRETLLADPYPARNIEERLSDLRAQLAANAAGVRLLGELCAQYGTKTIEAYMRHIRDNAAESVAALLESFPDGEYASDERLDSGATIRCAIRIDGRRTVVDFAGTDMQLKGNLNAPRAVTLAAVLYVFRALLGKPIPLNSGCLDPIEVRIPEGSLLDPKPPAAVVGGNVETSQRVVDVLLKALGKLAGSQGTMNNLTFGTDDWGYYETICGGAGAGVDFDGADAVHTHMTNTRITDPEVLERRYPVILREFSIRRGSGGAGKHRGGDGVKRAMEFREAMRVGILSERRHEPAHGLDGGKPGATGRNILVTPSGETHLPGHAQANVSPGDTLIIETPGGGGFGAPA